MIQDVRLTPAYILGRLAACYKTITGAEHIPEQDVTPGCLFDNPSELANKMMAKLESAQIPALIKPLYDSARQQAETLTDFPIFLNEINMKAFLDGYETQKYMLSSEFGIRNCRASAIEKECLANLYR